MTGQPRCDVKETDDAILKREGKGEDEDVDL